MRKLKLQMQLSVDGFVARPDGALDWMTWTMDDKLKQFIHSLTDSSDTILLGRKMTEGFVSHWENVVNNKPGSPEFSLAKKMVDTPKIVFSKTQKSMGGKNLVVENGDLVTAVENLKRKNGKDLVVYGGAIFVSNLIEKNLIDELNIFVNPTAIGTGLKIFKNTTSLELLESTAYECGIIVNTYRPS
jgi:dihydrofolate reductase